MNHATVAVQDFSKWNGQPFFGGAPPHGRHVYIVRNEDGSFLAYGTLDGTRRLLFEVRGANEKELHRFLAEMKAEGAKVTYGAPPFDTGTGGDPPTSGSTKPG